MILVCGIDPGLDGGVAFLHEDGNLQLFAAPVLGEGKGKRTPHLSQMVALFLSYPPDLVAIEKVGPMPKQGVTSCFNFGLGYGMWLGILAALKIPFQTVTPPIWKREILSGTSRDKLAAIQYIQSRYPTVTLLATPRSRVAHDGLAESACLAEYAMRLALRGGRPGGS